MGTGQILIDGTETFVPIFNRLREITKELVPYFVFIATGALAIYATRLAVKEIMRYLERKNKIAFYRYREGLDEEGNYYRKRFKRKKVKRKYIRRFR